MGSSFSLKEIENFALQGCEGCEILKIGISLVSLSTKDPAEQLFFWDQASVMKIARSSLMLADNSRDRLVSIEFYSCPEESQSGE